MRKFEVLYLSISYAYTLAMKHKLPPLSALRAFEAASHRENFAKAANDLNVTHSAISQQIRTLEDWLQVRLFERSGNGVILSEDGAALRPRVNEAFEILEEACAYARRTNDDKSINICAEPAFARRWLRPRLSEFRDSNPEINVYLYSGWDQKLPNNSNMDIIIHFEEQLHEFVHIVERLYPIDGYPACSPAFLEKHPDIHESSDISPLPLIHDNSRMMWRRWLNEYLPGNDAWKTGYVYSDLSLAIDAALDGEGLFLADDILCANDVASGALIKVLPKVLRCTWYCVAIDSNRATDAAVCAFLDWITKATGQDHNSNPSTLHNQ